MSEPVIEAMQYVEKWIERTPPGDRSPELYMAYGLMVIAACLDNTDNGAVSDVALAIDQLSERMNGPAS